MQSVDDDSRSILGGHQHGRRSSTIMDKSHVWKSVTSGSVSILVSLNQSTLSRKQTPQAKR